MKRIRGTVVDVWEEDIYPGEVYVRGGRVVKVQRGEGGGRYLLPALVDAHIHIESSMLIPSRFASLSLPHGTVALVADPHEIANVLGLPGVLWMMMDSSATPQKVFFTAPPCVPASAHESSGAVLTPEDIKELLSDPRVVALGEVMDVKGVLEGTPELMEKIRLAKKAGKPVDGHAPGLTGEALRRYFSLGISSDHECTTFEEVKERAAMGVLLLLRGGSASKSLDLLSAGGRRALCTDDLSAPDLSRGHMDRLLKEAVEWGADPLEAVEMASRIPAEHYRLPVGLLRPADPADVVVVRDLKDFEVEAVFVDGRVVARGGEALFELPPYLPANNFYAAPFPTTEFIHPVRGPAEVRVIRMRPDNLYTDEMSVELKEGQSLPDPSRDILLALCMDRYGTGKYSTAPLKGTGLKEGAVALTISHDSHNIIALGADLNDLAAALRRVIEMKGGVAISRGGRVLSLRLEVAGLMTGEEPHLVAERIREMERELKDMGMMLTSPLSQLSFLSLTVIPKLRLTPAGVFDVERGAYVEAVRTSL